MSDHMSIISGTSTDTGPDKTMNAAEYNAKHEQRNMKLQGEAWAPLCDYTLEYISRDHASDPTNVHMSRCKEWVDNLPDEVESFEEPIYEHTELKHEEHEEDSDQQFNANTSLTSAEEENKDDSPDAPKEPNAPTFVVLIGRDYRF